MFDSDEPFNAEALRDYMQNPGFRVLVEVCANIAFEFKNSPGGFNPMRLLQSFAEALYAYHTSLRQENDALRDQVLELIKRATPDMRVPSEQAPSQP